MAGSEGGPVDPWERKKKTIETLDRHRRGEKLTEQDWTIVQYALGGGCHACGGIKIAVAAGTGGENR